MKRKQKRVTLLLASLLVGGFLVTGCTNSDYDFNEIDATMGFGGDGLELPASSTMDIPLKDVLDLEENGSVKLDDEGNYLFQLTGSGSSEANPKIEPIRLEGRSYNANIPISLSASAKATRSLTASSGIPEVKEKMFEYHGVDKSVKSLTKANMKPVTMKLTLGFSGISSAISLIKKATLTLPGYLCLKRVEGNGNGVPTVNGSKIVIDNVSTGKNLELTITSNELLFSEQDAYGTLSIAEDGKIDMDGYFGLKIDDFELTGTPSTANMSIAAKVEVENIELTSATGVFDPEVNFGSLGEVDVTGVPDFLSDDNVVADLANPQILLTINNEMNVAATVKATVTATKSGQTTATVQLPEMYIEKNSVSPTIIRKTKCSRSAKRNDIFAKRNVYVFSSL